MHAKIALSAYGCRLGNWGLTLGMSKGSVFIAMSRHALQPMQSLLNGY